jgi:protein arginine N-methyltransferase 1
MAAGYAALVGHHRHLLDDRVRTRAFLRAIARVVRPGDAVADLGTGTGILAIAARRAGARAVWAIEHDPIVRVAAALARDNGVDGITFLEQPSSAAVLPEPIDVLVSECMGPFAIGGTMIRAVTDLRARCLAPGGRVIPRTLAMSVAPVDVPSVFAHVGAFRRARYGLRWQLAQRLATHNVYNTLVPPRALLAPGTRVHEIDLERDAWRGELRASVELAAARAGTVHGFAGWFDADLGGGVTLSTAPGKPETIWRQVFFPLPRPVTVARGARITLEMRCSNGEHFDWRGRVGRTAFVCSTRYSHPAALAD